MGQDVEDGTFLFLRAGDLLFDRENLLLNAFEPLVMALDVVLGLEDSRDQYNQNRV